MTFYNGLIGLFWLIFLAVWIFSSFGVKKGVSDSGSKRFTWRVLIVVILFFVFRAQLFHLLAPYDAAVEGNATIHLLGVILCGLGILFAFWARFSIGKNWGMPMTLKENPELVTSGPYKYVRHPIYTGTLVVILGSVLASSVLWIVVLALCSAYFLKSAEVEEKLMQKTFPEQYPAYKKRTKMLVPFVY